MSVSPGEAWLTLWLDCAAELLRRGRHAEAVQQLLAASRQAGAALQQALAGRPSADLLSDCWRAIESVLSEDGPLSSVPAVADQARISVIICSRDDARWNAVRAEYEQALAGGWFELIRIPDARSLSEGYNRGWELARGDVLIFSHDDLRLLAPDFRQELLAALQAFDLVGVAGATRLDGPSWASCEPGYRRQCVSYPSAGEAGFFTHVDGPWAARWHGGIQCLDGLFMAGRREVLGGLRFDAQRYDGFHFYDLDFSHRAWRVGLSLGVCPRLGIVHASTGHYDQAWQRYAQVFCAQYALPATMRPPTPSMGFTDEGQLRAFLRAMRGWQQACVAAPGLTGTASAQAPRLLLHVGCGDKTRVDCGPGFQGPHWQELRVDADPAARPDLAGSITDLSAVPDASVDAVFSSHMLEHLYWDEVPLALAEMRRVLKPAGFALAWVPDLQAAARLIAEDRLFDPIGTTPFGPLTAYDMVFSHRGATGRDKPWMAHHGGFTMKTLAQAHQAAGFASIVSRSRLAGFDLQCLATREAVPAELLQALCLCFLVEPSLV